MSKTAGDVATAAARHLLGAVAGIAIIPIIARTLGVDALGAWTLIGTASFVLGVADLGLSTCVQRAVARRDYGDARAMVALALAAITTAGPLMAVASWVVLRWVLPRSLGAQADAAAAIALLGGLVSAVAFPYRALLLVRGDMRALAWARGCGAFAQVGVTTASLLATRSLLAPAIGVLTASALETALTLAAARRRDPDVPLTPGVPRERGRTRDALSVGAATLTVNVAALAASRLDVLIIAEVAPLWVVAAYGVASRAVDQAYVLAKQVGAGLLPRLADSANRQRAVATGTQVMGAVVASGMPALALDGRALLVAWAGPIGGSPTATVAAGLLGAAATVAATQEVAASALTLSGERPWAPARALLAGTVVNVGLSVASAPWLGAPGVAAATIAGNLVTAVLMWRWLMPILAWPRGELGRALSVTPVAAATALGVAHLLRSVAASGPMASLAACTVASLSGVLAAGLVVWGRSSRTRGESTAADAFGPP